jgi:hypothetical protein
MSIQLIHGAGEIKRIDKQIKDAFEILKTCQFREGGVSIKKMDKICDLGFDYNHSSGDTFIGKRQVIKMALFTRRPPPLKYRVPTMIYAPSNISARDWDWDFVIAIQPKVNVDDHIDHKWGTYFSKKLVGCDAHGDNYGIYKGEVKLFDW